MKRSDLLLIALVVAVGQVVNAEEGASPAKLRQMAADYYRWRNLTYPVASSDQGLHTWDDKLTDYSAEAVAAQHQHVNQLLAQVKGMATDSWSRDDRIDWLLFRAQLEREAFWTRVLHFEETNPQIYVRECGDAIFSLLKKEYAPPRNRALAATARLRRMPALLDQAKGNLKRPVRLYARLAIESARSIDSLFGKSLMTLAEDLSPYERQELVRARDAALAALHGFADWLEQRLPGMVAFSPMGEENTTTC